jgi:PAS domain S-box-containing protein
LGMSEKDMDQIADSSRFKAFFNYASLGIVVVDGRGAIVSINPFALGLFGYTAAEVIQQNISKLIPQRYHQRHAGHQAAYMQQPTSRPMGIGRELFAIKKDGTEFAVEISLGNYNDGDERFVIAFVNDISLRKQAQDKLEQLNDELEATVDQRTQELREAMRQLERSKENLAKLLEKEKELSELKSRFVSMASHEFRTPLSTILSSAYLVEKYKESAEQPKREKHLHRIISSVNLLTDILNDFLNVGKIEEGKLQVRMADLDLPGLIEVLVQEMQLNVRKGQTVVYQHKGEKTIWLDASLLRHIVMNLVSNAIKFSPEGATIEVYSLVTDERVQLQVKDKGIGISQEDQAHLMERFFRGANATNVQGTGLGLHIVAKYAELMDGTINCQSELEKGSTFTVDLKRRIPI